MIVQNVSVGGHADISFTAPKADLPASLEVTRAVADELGAGDVTHDAAIARVSLIGAGMKTHPGVAATMFQTLAESGVNILMISTSSIRISCVVRSDAVEQAVAALHTRFELDQPPVQGSG
jgi:aspartate kinase